MANRNQSGQIIERSGSFYVRYYVPGLEGKKRVTSRLCAKDGKHRNVSCAPVKLLRDQFKDVHWMQTSAWQMAY